MADSRQIVESISTILRSDNVTLSAEIVALATHYADLCREANQRLRRCADFLREGLVGEALAFADARPTLAEFVSSLQLREPLEWDRVCGGLGLTRPERLMTQTVKELADAAIRHQPIRDLLQKHRYLALARQSPADRLIVVRQLIALDATSPIWRREAEELEQARLATLRDEVSAAVDARDVQRVDQLVAELQSAGWQSPIPFDLKETLAKTSSALHQQIAIGQLSALVPQVREAFASQSYEQCKTIFATWGIIVTQSRVRVPLELRNEILPLAHWIDEQDELRQREKQFRAACSAIKLAADTHETIEELKSLYHAAAKFEMDLPPDISAAYHDAITRRRKEIHDEKMRQFGLAAALVGAIVAALGALTLVMLNVGRH